LFSSFHCSPLSILLHPPHNSLTPPPHSSLFTPSSQFSLPLLSHSHFFPFLSIFPLSSILPFHPFLTFSSSSQFHSTHFYPLKMKLLNIFIDLISVFYPTIPFLSQLYSKHSTFSPLLSLLIAVSSLFKISSASDDYYGGAGGSKNTHSHANHSHHHSHHHHNSSSHSNSHNSKGHILSLYRFIITIVLHLYLIRNSKIPLKSIEQNIFYKSRHPKYGLLPRSILILIGALCLIQILKILNFEKFFGSLSHLIDIAITVVQIVIYKESGEKQEVLLSLWVIKDLFRLYLIIKLYGTENGYRSPVISILAILIQVVLNSYVLVRYYK